jgi:hypothetical protein
MSTTGRPPALDETKKSRILALLRSGCSRARAASAVNCHPETIANTAKRDPQFADHLAQADSAALLIHLRNVNNAAADVKYWRASAWMLERLCPDMFAKPSRDLIAPEQLSALLLQVAEIIVQEVPVATFRAQVLKRFDRLLKEASLAANPPVLDCRSLPSSISPQPASPE